MKGRLFVIARTRVLFVSPWQAPTLLFSCLWLSVFGLWRVFVSVVCSSTFLQTLVLNYHSIPFLFSAPTFRCLCFKCHFASLQYDLFARLLFAKGKHLLTGFQLAKQGSLLLCRLTANWLISRGKCTQTHTGDHLCSRCSCHDAAAVCARSVTVVPSDD